MAYVISSDCISCGACEGGCPVGAISMGDEHMMIDAGTSLIAVPAPIPAPWARSLRANGQPETKTSAVF